MRKTNLFALAVATSFSASAFAQELSGFAYGSEQAPRGYESKNAEWESPQELALNKEQPRAWFFNFANEESARKVLPENSE